MSVRRLADDAVQPAAFAFSKANAAWARETIRKYPKGRQHSAVIPLLMRAQEQEGWVTRPAVEHVAEMLDMPLIRVLEVATFYTQFQLAPVGTRAHVQVCGTTPCMLRGAGDLVELCKRKIHPEPLTPNEAGTLSWEEVECQGACVNAPMVMIFKDTYEDLTAERLEEIIDAFEAGRGDSIDPGPQIDRLYSAPASGPTTLTDEAAILRSDRDKGAGRRARRESPEEQVPPSRAAKPKTAARETEEALKSPSEVKASSNGEKRASVAPPEHDEAAADKAAGRPRHHAGRPSGDPSHRAPELKHDAPVDQPAKQAAPDVRLDDRDRPEAMRRPARPDDLKLISGVGPKIEGLLNELGIYTFEQVAGWKKAERAWVDSYLRFRGRIERDDWVRQAKALAKGGAAEYERVFGKKPR
ncbi:NADH-quinone oxidoreductase subunit E [Aquibium sp. A9E412]|uniref:NADH-quinone oxidoreductase subunit E n=1 Tax=Aquibium sp. A9E412 TaxID=2976767 RepID=UPI0025B24C1E|nr:NADH-quinone oxidoreductase subunit E [Aquibium sp. A9E412]MDN2567494.1 NADH-quinone oxidoreductase subunit E [Aquibium sp. A9E412]